jgi:hypothetical protein
VREEFIGFIEKKKPRFISVCVKFNHIEIKALFKIGTHKNRNIFLMKRLYHGNTP